MSTRSSWMVIAMFTALAAAGCKPKAGSNVTAIVGNDNGQEKAFALVSVRNSYQMNQALNVVNNPELSATLRKMNEPMFAQVECTASNSNGKAVTADAWMNYVEYLSFLGLLYLTPDRQLEFLLDSGSGPRSHRPNCGLVGAPLMSLPLLVGASKEIHTLPPEAPAPGSAEDKDLFAKYELMQTIYLALRGPYSDSGAMTVSAKAVGLAEAAGNYKELRFSDTDLARAFADADAFYNPCSRATPQGSLVYLKDWKLRSYSCAPSAVAGLSNYRAGGASGGAYVRLRDDTKAKILELYRAAHGVPTAQSGNERLILEVLSSPVPWSQMTGPAAGVAAYFSGGAAKGFGLAGGEEFDFLGFVRGSASAAAEGGDGEGFALNGPTPGELRPQSGNFRYYPILTQLVSQLGASGGSAITDPRQMTGYMAADWGSSLQNKSAANLIKGDYFYANRYNEAVNQAFNQMLRPSAAKAQATISQLHENWIRQDPARNLESVAGKEFFQRRTQVLDSFAPDLQKYEAIAKENGVLSWYGNRRVDSGVLSATNIRGDTLTKGEGIDGGAFRDYRREPTTDGGMTWVDRTGDRDSTDTTDVVRRVGWTKEGNGWQRVATGSVNNTTGAPDLDFTYGFRPNRPGSSVGQFFMNEQQLASANTQLNSLVDRVQSTATTNAQGVNRPDLSNTDIRSGMAAGENSAYRANTNSFWNGLSSMWGGMGTTGAAVQAQDQINEQSRFARGNSSLLGSMQEASSEIAQARQQGVGQTSAGARQAWDATTNYTSDAMRRGGGSYWGAASTMAGDAWGQVANTSVGRATGSLFGGMFSGSSSGSGGSGGGSTPAATTTPEATPAATPSTPPMETPPAGSDFN